MTRAIAILLGTIGCLAIVAPAARADDDTRCLNCTAGPSSAPLELKAHHEKKESTAPKDRQLKGQQLDKSQRQLHEHDKQLGAHDKQFRSADAEEPAPAQELGEELTLPPTGVSPPAPTVLPFSIVSPPGATADGIQRMITLSVMH